MNVYTHKIIGHQYGSNNDLKMWTRVNNYPVCGMVHIKEPLLLIEKSSS